MPIPYIETLSFSMGANNDWKCFGITSKVQCIKIGNEHDLALDVIPEREYHLGGVILSKEHRLKVTGRNAWWNNI